MANTFTLTSDKYDGRYMQLACSQTTDIATNTSTISWTLSSIGGNSNYYATGPTTVTINGEQVYYKARTNASSYAFPAAKGSTSGTLKVKHNNNGEKAISVSFSTAIYWGESSVKAYSDSWTLNKIPRAVQFVSAPDFNDEDNPTITYSNLTGDAVSEVQACISFTGADADIAYRPVDKDGTSYTYTFTDAEREVLRAGVLNGSNSRTVVFYLRTKIGNDYFYEKVNKTLTIVNATPTINPTVIDTNAKTLAVTENSSVFISGYSNLAYAFNATTYKGASISTYSAVCGSAKATTATGTFNGIAANSVAFTATDNRGLKATKTIQLDFVNYSHITCDASAKIEMSGETTAKVTIEAKGYIYCGSLGATANHRTLKIEILRSDKEDWEDITSEILYTIDTEKNTYNFTYPIDGLDYMKAFTYQLRLSDALSDATTAADTLKIYPVFDWSDTDFNFNVPIQLDGDTVLRHSQYTKNIIISAENGFIYFRPQGTESTIGELKISPQGNIELTGDIIINGKSLKSLLNI